VDKVLGPDDVFEVRRALDAVYVDDRLKGYIVDIIRATRSPADYGLDLGPFIQLGSSPRGVIALTLAARGQALLEARPYVKPEDVKAVAPDVLRHRLGITYEAEAEEITPDTIVQRILDHLPVP
jgi:MoxR-like ATPase